MVNVVNIPKKFVDQFNNKILILQDPINNLDEDDEYSYEKLFDEKINKSKFKCSFNGSNNTLIIGYKSQYKALNINFQGDNAICIIGNVGYQKFYPEYRFNFNINLNSNSSVRIGNNVTSTGVVNIWCLHSSITNLADTLTVSIGNDCMFANDIEIATTDFHPIYDVNEKKRINFDKSVLIGDHVWIARNVTILKGAQIDTGSIIGAKAIVNKAIPKNVVAVGVPAKVVKTGVTWERGEKFFRVFKGNLPYWNV